MKCAVISLKQNENKNFSFLDIFKIKRSIISSVNIINATDDVFIYTIPYNIADACELKEKKAQRIVDKCVNELMRHGVGSVYLTDDMLNFMPCGNFFKQFKVPTGRRIFDLLLCDILKWCAKKEQINMLDARVGVWQEHFDEHGYKILENICEKFKDITLYTESDDVARIYADKLCEQSGLAVGISKNISELNECNIVIAADKLARAPTNEKTILIDESGLCPFRCRNAIEFSLAFGFNALMDYFVVCDQRCMEFLFDCCGINISHTTDITRDLELIGCRFKKVLYNTHKNIDKLQV